MRGVAHLSFITHTIFCGFTLQLIFSTGTAIRGAAASPLPALQRVANFLIKLISKFFSSKAKFFVYINAKKGAVF